MKRTRAVFAFLIIFTSFALVLPAFANHLWDFVSVSCDASSHKLKITATYHNDSSDEAEVIYDIYVDGHYVTTYQPYEDGEIVANGKHTFTVSNSAFTWGAKVRVQETEEDSTTCGNVASAGSPCGNLSDGRINNVPGLDCAAPIAIFKDGVYAVDPQTGAGTLAVPLSDTLLHAPHDATQGNVLIASGVNPSTGQTINVYWLTSNEIEVRTTSPDGKTYDVVWPVDRPADLYHLSA